MTDLLHPDRYPAADLLALYLARWGIERVFQQVTEVFPLEAAHRRLAVELAGIFRNWPFACSCTT